MEIITLIASSGIINSLLVEHLYELYEKKYEKNNVDSSNDTSCSYKCCTTVYA